MSENKSKVEQREPTASEKLAVARDLVDAFEFSCNELGVYRDPEILLFAFNAVTLPHRRGNLLKGIE